MTFNVLIEHEARQDIIETRDWYNYEKDGLGDEYLQEFQKVVEFKRSNPFLFRIRKLGIRKVRVGRRFPFYVCYKVKDNTILVFAVLHGSRNPQVWLQRKRKGS